jgi:AsmA protein
VTDLRATVAVKEDEVTFEEARFSIFGGAWSLAGTRARLAPVDRPFALAAKAEGVQVDRALAAWTTQKALTGRLDLQVALAGKGETTEALLKALDGTVEGKLLDGVFLGKDLVSEVSDPLVRAIPSLRRRAGSVGTTSLGKVVPFSLRVRQGRAAFQEPMEIKSQDFTATVRGSAGLDGDLDLPVNLRLGAGVVSELSGGRVRLKVPIPVTFVLKGKAWSPRLSELDVGPAVKSIAGALGVQAIGKALGTGPGGADGDAAAARKKAAEDADAARKKLEQDARKALKKLFGG